MLAAASCSSTEGGEAASCYTGYAGSCMQGGRSNRAAAAAAAAACRGAGEACSSARQRQQQAGASSSFSLEICGC